MSEIEDVRFTPPREEPLSPILVTAEDLRNPDMRIFTLSEDQKITFIKAYTKSTETSSNGATVRAWDWPGPPPTENEPPSNSSSFYVLKYSDSAQELKLMSRLRGYNIIPDVVCFMKDGSSNGYGGWIIMKRVTNAETFDEYDHEYKTLLPLKWWKVLINKVHDMHKLGVYHNDLHMNNVMFEMDGKNIQDVFIIDFDRASFAKDKDDYRKASFYGFILDPDYHSIVKACKDTADVDPTSSSATKRSQDIFNEVKSLCKKYSDEEAIERKEWTAPEIQKYRQEQMRKSVKRYGRISPDVIDLTEQPEESPRKKKRTSISTAATVEEEESYRYHLVIVVPKGWEQFIVYEKDWPSDHKIRDHHIEIWQHLKATDSQRYGTQVIDFIQHDPNYQRLATHLLRETDIAPDLAAYQSDDDDDDMKDIIQQQNNNTTIHSQTQTQQERSIFDDLEEELSENNTQ